MMLLEEGRLALDDPIAGAIPELAEPSVLRTPDAALDDVVALARPITVEDLLSSRAGWGFPEDFSLPGVQPIFTALGSGPARPAGIGSTDEWLAALAAIPLLAQPGEQWLYNTCSDLQGVLIERVSGQPLADFLAERLFGPLGMVDTGFVLPADKADRVAAGYGPTDAGLVPIDRSGEDWTQPPAFASGAGGLASTADDLLAFLRMILGRGESGDRRVLSADSVRQLTTDHLTPAQRAAGTLFLDGQGWGYGGSVDVAAINPWNSAGRYGWIGGSGTSAFVAPVSGTISILLTGVALTGPVAPPLMREFWTAEAAF
jgi:CubicO group peptidase (beta-lactamase class C family)